MESADSSFAYSQTASLNSVATELNQFLNNTNYWASPDMPRQVDLKPVLNENELRYFNYRQQRYLGDVQYVYMRYQAVLQDSGFSASVTPDLQLSLAGPYEAYGRTQLDPRLYPRGVPKAPVQARNGVPGASDKLDKQYKSGEASANSSVCESDDGAQYEWKKLMHRAQKVLYMKCRPAVSESQIKLVFERLLSRLETEYAHDNLPKCAKAAQPPKSAVRKGAVLKSLPAGCNDSRSSEDCENEAESRKACHDDFYAKDVTDSSAETQLARLYGMFEVRGPEQLIYQASAARQALTQLPALKQRFIQAATRLYTLTSYTARAAEFPPRDGFSALFDDFGRRCEDYFIAVETELMRAREVSRLRGRLCEVLNVPPAGTSLYDVIRQNNVILERVALQQSNSQAQQAGAFVWAEEFAERCAEAGIGISPTETNLVQYADTVLAAAGRYREEYARQCVRRAAEEHPRILVRLTDDEAFQAFQAIMYVFAHFTRLFSTKSVQRIITRLTEVHNYCAQSQSLIAAQKRILGLNAAASPSKLLETIQAVAAQAAADAGVLAVEEAEKIMNALGVQEVGYILGAIKALAQRTENGQATRSQFDADSESESESESG